MAGTVTTTEQTFSNVKLVTFDWTSSSGGAADATTTALFDGKVIWVVTDPGATAPTADWDVTIADANSIDLLGGNGADRSATATEYIADANLGVVASSTLTLGVTNAGNAKTGTVYVYIR